ncbi:MAG: 4Fe-4S cluster-binding domain-containing protein, partial [Promethearchaeota archaeon]
MWRLIRPDAKRAWSDHEVVRRLSRYRDIIDQKRTAKYLLAKTQACDIDLDSSAEELWRVHKEDSDKFTKLVETVDSGSDVPRPASNLERNFLNLKIELAHRILADCHFCERKCGADRTRDEKGWCKLGATSRVSSAFLHTGEEAPLVPSGTIFFSSCCFGCVFCQNHDISTNPNSGQPVGPEGLASIAETLFRQGALNINYVGGDPIPNTHTIIASLVHQTSNMTQLW